ncbi:hypothetical protein [Rhizosphaericola mali]|uniref:Lipoprotein n=1 Tax=Rhizosphaericola mali TaxID=2545455 RepID=A0A5P2G337_9BACT|nr:hypothetical protein [Rhizosphaericola mali]QES89617.1 hypothetical protein E0W69_013405 [Rhizosphaericola mali]
MKLSILLLLFNIIILSNILMGCKKTGVSNIWEEKLYRYTNEVYYESPIMYIKGKSITDKNVIASYLNNYSVLSNEKFHIEAGMSKIYEGKVFTTAILIQPKNQVTEINDFTSYKDSVLFDIADNVNGEYHLVQHDSTIIKIFHASNSYFTSCDSIIDGITIKPIQSLIQSYMNLPYDLYKTKGQSFISFKEGNLYRKELNFICNSKNCWSYFSPSLDIISDSLSKLESKDTIVVQRLQFIYK